MQERLKTAQGDTYPEMVAQQEPLRRKQDEFLGVLRHAVGALTDCDKFYIHQSDHIRQVYIHHATATLDHGLTWNQNFI
jgi:hypothetical protein